MEIDVRSVKFTLVPFYGKNRAKLQSGAGRNLRLNPYSREVIFISSFLPSLFCSSTLPAPASSLLLFYLPRTDSDHVIESIDCKRISKMLQPIVVMLW